MIKKILIISFLVIALTLIGCSPSGVLSPVTSPSPSLAATNTNDIEIKDDESLNNQTADTDNIQEESLNGQDDSQEVVEVEEADGEVEAYEPAGGYQDQDNTDVDHQFEGVE
jgi:hypothetical protein